MAHHIAIREARNRPLRVCDLSRQMGLLKGIPPLLNADLLYVLRSMGHGDKLCVCDCNFPAAECATKTTSGDMVSLSCDLPTALDAICTVLPLDFFVDSPAAHMSPQEGLTLPPAGTEVTEALKAAILKHCPVYCVEARTRTRRLCYLVSPSHSHPSLV